VPALLLAIAADAILAMLEQLTLHQHRASQHRLRATRLKVSLLVLFQLQQEADQLTFHLVEVDQLTFQA